MDLRLPVGTPQGLSIARMARNHRPGLPVIFVADEPELVELVEQVGEENSPVMLKPIDLNLLVAKVHDLLAVAVETPPKAGS
ncbi:MAG TPA: hypothetical protein VN828_15205 [Acidobacteriaceae bacterium]|nr:hypothetical protein [Acidobacteriaceae bacterium]